MQWPRWTRSGRRRETALALTVAALAAISYSWNLGSAGYGTFYSSAARSMSMSWRAFWFGAFDPGAHITLDKLSGFLIPQALSARLLGYHPWTLALPQVFEGVVTVLAVYVIGRRWRGPAVGLLAAFAAAVTPLFASMFGHVMEDCLLTMSMALALLCWQSALLRLRVRSVLFAGLWIGIGFQAKMMQAWVILPGLLLGLLFVLGFSRLRRLAALSAFLFTTAATSLAWMTIIQSIPAHRRPVIDGTTNNNIFSMVFGYNGFNRVIPRLVPGVISTPPAKVHTPVLSIVQHARTLPAAIIPSGLEHNKLLLPYYATQIGWLYPAAGAGLLVEVWLLIRLLRRRWADRPSADLVASGIPQRVTRPQPSGASEAMTVALVVWLALSAGLLSVTQVPHVAYLATMGVQLVLLAAAGLVTLARYYRRRPGPSSFAFPALVVLSALWAGYLLRKGQSAPLRLSWIVLIVGAMAALLLVLARLVTARWDGPARPRLLGLSVAAGLVAVLLAPTLWTGYVFDRAADGSANEAYAGPRPGRHQTYEVSRPYSRGPELRLNANQRKLLATLAAKGAGRSTILTDNWTIAATYLLAAPVRVMNMGGYSGLAPTPRLTQVQQLIAAGTVRYVLLLHERQPRRIRTAVVGTDDRWIRSRCTELAGYGLMDLAVVPHRSVDVYRCDDSSLRNAPRHKPVRHRTGTKHNATGTHHSSGHKGKAGTKVAGGLPTRPVEARPARSSVLVHG